MGTTWWGGSAAGAVINPTRVAAPVAPEIAPSPGGGKCPTIYDLKLKVFVSGPPALGRSLALSDTPPVGMYWRVLQVDAVDTDAAAVRPIGFFLTPPGLPLSNPLNSNLPNVFPFMVNTISLGVGQGDSNVSNTQTIAAGQGGWASPTSMLPIFVPSGWQLGAVDLISAVNANPVQIFLRVLYVEVSNDIPLDF